MALLSFRCRNKLLLCGNPRLNSLSHLCSYLYFIMPALFDSSPELSEWLITQLESPFDKLPDDKNSMSFLVAIRTLQKEKNSNRLFFRYFRKVAKNNSDFFVASRVQRCRTGKDTMLHLHSSCMCANQEATTNLFQCV